MRAKKGVATYLGKTMVYVTPAAYNHAHPGRHETIRSSESFPELRGLIAFIAVNTGSGCYDDPMFNLRVQEDGPPPDWPIAKNKRSGVRVPILGDKIYVSGVRYTKAPFFLMAFGLNKPDDTIVIPPGYNPIRRH